MSDAPKPALVDAEMRITFRMPGGTEETGELFTTFQANAAKLRRIEALPDEERHEAIVEAMYASMHALCK